MLSSQLCVLHSAERTETVTQTKGYNCVNSTNKKINSGSPPLQVKLKYLIIKCVYVNKALLYELSVALCRVVYDHRVSVLNQVRSYLYATT